MAIRDMIHWDRSAYQSLKPKTNAVDPLNLLQNAINRLFDEFLDDASETQRTRNSVFPAIEIPHRTETLQKAKKLQTPKAA